jgi:hypothetical protein
LSIIHDNPEKHHLILQMRKLRHKRWNNWVKVEFSRLKWRR